MEEPPEQQVVNYLVVDRSANCYYCTRAIDNGGMISPGTTHAASHAPIRALTVEKSFLIGYTDFVP